MVALETLLRAAEGAREEAELVHRDFEVEGVDSWIRAAIRNRVDPSLAARVVPAAYVAVVVAALEAFYRLWACAFPGEFRRVRREWIVLQARWAGGRVEGADGHGVLRRLLRSRLLDPRPVVRGRVPGGFDAALEEPRVEVRASPEQQAVGGDAPEAREAPAGRSVEEDAAGVEVPGSGTEDSAAPGPEWSELDEAAFGEVGAELVLAEGSHTFESAVRKGPEAVDAFVETWVSSGDFWREWPGTPRERGRER